MQSVPKIPQPLALPQPLQQALSKARLVQAFQGVVNADDLEPTVLAFETLQAEHPSRNAAGCMAHAPLDRSVFGDFEELAIQSKITDR